MNTSSSVYFGVSIVEILFIIPKKSNFIKNIDGNSYHISVKEKTKDQMGSVFTYSLIAFLASDSDWAFVTDAGAEFHT